MPSERTAPPSPETPAKALRQTLQTARDELIADTRLARGGIEAVARYSARVDDLIRSLYREARNWTETPVALVALGGYGRNQLCLHSDIDLLVLFADPIGAAEERFLKSILHPLWDLRLDLGHHVRELADFGQVDTDNPEYLVALRDARFLDGDRAVFDHFADVCLGPGTKWLDPTLAALRDLIEQRYGQYNRTLYHLEPDVKSAPGALRDVSAMRMISRLTESRGQPDIPVGRVDEAEDFLLRLRSILHLERGRNLNVLTHELQEVAAQLFESPGEQLTRQVEALMSTYFHHARIIGRGLGSSLQSLAPAAASDPVPIGDDLVRRENGIAFTDGTRASLRPRMWLSAFEAALSEDCAVSEQVLTCIERHGGRYSPERFFPTTDERDRLLRVLQPRPGLYARLSEMHDTGLLGRMFPEFQKIYCHVIRDFYHKYTVDEHTLLTIRNIELLCNPITGSRKRFLGLLRELPAPELLVLALLFHDVGKWTNKNHAEEGVRMALGALRRIRLSEPDIATVEFLIRHHLRMSTAAFRRDADDPEVVHQFARLVGTEQRLKLLCLFTLADVGAVAPDVMTPWKEELLWQLYVDTYNRLTLGYGDEVIDATATSLDDLLAGRPDDISTHALETFVEGLPQRYLRSVDRPHVYEHVRLSRDLQPTEVHCTLEQKESVWELTVVSVDQPRLFSKICGVLSYFGMAILRGQAMTNRQGLVVDIFQFTDQEQFFELNQSAQPELARLLAEVVAGREDIDQTILPKARGLARKGPARVRSVVHFDNAYSKRFSILEIVTEDTWGLLYRVSRVISRHECDIEFVLISTEGTRAIDVFHLKKGDAKLSPDDVERLQADLESVLKETDEATQGNRPAEQG